MNVLLGYLYKILEEGIARLFSEQVFNNPARK